MFLSGEVRELHHDGRADGKDLVDMLLFYEFLDTYGNNAFLAIRAIVSHDDNLVRRFTDLILKNNQILRATSHFGEYTVTLSLQRLDDRQHGSNTQTTTSTYHRAVVLDAGGVAQRTYDVSNIVALVQCT